MACGECTGNGCELFERTQRGEAGGNPAGAAASETIDGIFCLGDGEGMEEVSKDGYAAITLADGDGR